MADSTGLSARRNVFRRLAGFSSSLGIEPRKLFYSLAGVPKFLSDSLRYRRQPSPAGLALSAKYLYPILNESRAPAGSVASHYFQQDLWAARKIFARQPRRHVDIGSRLDGFVAHLLVFTDVEMVDVRPLTTPVRGLTFIQDDATELRSYPSGSLESVSSLHAAEHFGLGRYGDPVDPGAHIKFMASLERVLAGRGRLYFSTPIGRQRLEFNAHRVLSPDTVLSQFERLQLVSVSYIDDDARFHEDVQPDQIPRQMEYGCGLFEFTK